MIQNAVAVFFGGAFGALLRYLVSVFLPVNKWGIPFTIIIVNFAGCFLMGFLDSLLENQASVSTVKFFLMTGLLGGFTTFSAFSLEFSVLLRQGQVASSFIYAAVSVLSALAGFFAGYAIAKLMK